MTIDLETREERAATDPTISRRRTEAGVSVDVGDDTRIRGGVRVEQESEREREEPVPTIGVEKRF